jgi:hypothetical protein
MRKPPAVPITCTHNLQPITCTRFKTRESHGWKGFAADAMARFDDFEPWNETRRPGNTPAYLSAPLGEKSSGGSKTSCTPANSLCIRYQALRHLLAAVWGFVLARLAAFVIQPLKGTT